MHYIRKHDATYIWCHHRNIHNFVTVQVYPGSDSGVIINDSIPAVNIVSKLDLSYTCWIPQSPEREYRMNGADKTNTEWIAT